jgi:phosphoglycolate phosphatase
MLLEILNQLSVSPENALMIGDTSHDLEMARAAGVDALAMTYGAHPEEGLRGCGPLGCFGDVASLAQWLKTNA